MGLSKRSSLSMRARTLTGSTEECKPTSGRVGCRMADLCGAVNRAGGGDQGEQGLRQSCRGAGRLDHCGDRLCRCVGADLAGPEKWAAKRPVERRWREVRALGLDDIVLWLRKAPRAEFWLARRLGLRPEEFEIGPKWWARRQHSTGGLFDSAVALGGRRNAAEDLQKRIDDGQGQIVVEASAVGEALDFIAAAGETSGTLGGGRQLIEWCLLAG